MLRSFFFALLFAGEAILGFACISSTVRVERVEVTMVFGPEDAHQKENTPQNKVIRETNDDLNQHSSGIVEPEEFGVEFQLEVGTARTSTTTAGVLKFLSEDLEMDMAVGRMEGKAEAAKKTK